MKPTPAELAEIEKDQAAKDRLCARGLLSERESNSIQNKIENRKEGKARGVWGKRFKGGK